MVYKDESADFPAFNYDRYARLFSNERGRPYQSVTLRIEQEPLTPVNFAAILDGVTDLHTLCWLIANRRFADAVAYSQQPVPEFIQEASLSIEKITHNSPAEIKLNLDASPETAANAFVTMIDGIVQAGQRHRDAKLRNEEKEQTLAHSRKLQKRELERQDQSLSYEQQSNELELARQELAIETQRKKDKQDLINAQVETARNVVNLFSQPMNEALKAALQQAMIPTITKLLQTEDLQHSTLPSTPTLSR